MVSLLVFIGVIIFSVLAVFFAVYNIRYAIEENKKYVKKHMIGLLILSAGFIIHTLGDFLSPIYGRSMELGLESTAHIIILISFIFFIISAREILNSVKGYWFK
jgi:hypothetical protein